METQHWRRFLPLCMINVSTRTIRKECKRKCQCIGKGYRSAFCRKGLNQVWRLEAPTAQPALHHTCSPKSPGPQRDCPDCWNPTSHAGHTAAVNDANREEPSLHHSQHHASSESNGNDIMYAQSRFRVKAAQHQQPGMRAGEHVMSSWEGTFFHTSDRTSCFDWLYVMYLTFITWFSLYMMIHHHTTPHHTTPHHTTPHHTTPHRTAPHHAKPHHTALHHTTPDTSFTSTLSLADVSTSSLVTSHKTKYVLIPVLHMARVCILKKKNKYNHVNTICMLRLSSCSMVTCNQQD